MRRIWPLPPRPGQFWERRFCKVCRMGAWVTADGRTLGLKIVIDPRNEYRLCRDCRKQVVRQESAESRRQPKGLPCPVAGGKVW